MTLATMDPIAWKLVGTIAGLMLALLCVWQWKRWDRSADGVIVSAPPPQTRTAADRLDTEVSRHRLISGCYAALAMMALVAIIAMWLLL